MDVPLNKIVGIVGVPGSGKSSLAPDVLYTDGSRRNLDALVLRQWPGGSGISRTFGAETELLNSQWLMFLRLVH